MKKIFHFGFIAIIVVLMVPLSTNVHADKINFGNKEILELLKEHDVQINDDLLVIIEKILENERNSKAIMDSLENILNACRDGECCDAWDKVIPYANSRFELVMPTAENPEGEAVLDRETCLVWERSPDMTALWSWAEAVEHCLNRRVGDRLGWHLPTVDQLASLVDSTQSNPPLTSGHPFLFSYPPFWYWTSTTEAGKPTHAWGVAFIGNGIVSDNSKGGGNLVWCVRGGQGHDAF